MKLKFILVLLVSLIIRTGNVLAQDDNTKTAVAKDDPAAVALTKNLSEEEAYVWPKDPKVMENLKKWQGYKFGLLIHMGLYSELGIVESWALCPEDWITRPGYDDYYQFSNDYRNTKNRFNPVNFDPEKWAKMFKNSGAKVHDLLIKTPRRVLPLRHEIH
jgi:hypothetical protein